MLLFICGRVINHLPGPRSQKPPSLNDITFTSEVRNILTLYCSSHDNILLMGDFNMTPKNPRLNELIENNDGLSNVISEQAYFKSISTTCTDNFLTNKKLVL